MPQIIDWYRIQKTIEISTLSDERKEYYMSRLMALEKQDNEFAGDEVKDILRIFYQSQADPVVYAFSYNQTDIKKHLRKLK